MPALREDIPVGQQLRFDTLDSQTRASQYAGSRLDAGCAANPYDHVGLPLQLGHHLVRAGALVGAEGRNLVDLQVDHASQFSRVRRREDERAQHHIRAGQRHQAAALRRQCTQLLPGELLAVGQLAPLDRLRLTRLLATRRGLPA